MTARILIIDSDQDLLEFFRLLLEEEGYTVMLSARPISQVDEIESLHPDVILLDFVFGEQQIGRVMMEMLKNHARTCTIPLILCSAEDQTIRLLQPYLALKNIRIIHKPFELTTLLEEILQALPVSKPLRQIASPFPSIPLLLL